MTPDRSSYRRIVIEESGGDEGSDYSQLYQFLLDCVRDPLYGLTVTEVVLDVSTDACMIALDDKKLSNALKQLYPVQNEAATVTARDSPFRDLIVQTGLSSVESHLKVLAWQEQVIARRRDGIVTQPDPPPNTPALQRLHQNEGWLIPSQMDGHFLALAGVMALALCSNASSLIYMGQGGGYVDEFLRSNNAGALPGKFLQNLRHVVIYPQEVADNRVYNMSDPVRAATLFHRLPSLESLSFHGLFEACDSQDYYIDCWPPGAGDFSTLRFTRSALTFDAIFPLIRMSKRLEELHLQIGGRELEYGQGCAEPFDGDMLNKALWKHRDVLVELDLDVGGHAGTCTASNYMPADQDTAEKRKAYLEEKGSSEEGHEEQLARLEEDDLFQADKGRSYAPDELYAFDIPATSPFRDAVLGIPSDFSALKRLSINAALLLGKNAFYDNGEPAAVVAPFRLVDVLPQSLEYLCIRGYVRGEVGEWDGQMDELMEKKAEKLPNLVQVLGVDETVETLAPPPDLDDLDDEYEDTDALLLGEQGRSWVEV